MLPEARRNQSRVTYGYWLSSEEHRPLDLVRAAARAEAAGFEFALASATCGALMEGRFFLGVGTGENLNEHAAGAWWPAPGQDGCLRFWEQELRPELAA